MWQRKERNKHDDLVVHGVLRRSKIRKGMHENVAKISEDTSISVAATGTSYIKHKTH